MMHSMFIAHSKSMHKAIPLSRDKILECLEDFVLSFLTKLSDALPGAYSQLKGQPSNQKVTLQLADRTKESPDEYGHNGRTDA